MGQELPYHRRERHGGKAQWDCDSADFSVWECPDDGAAVSVRGPRGGDGVLVRLQFRHLGAHRGTINGGAVAMAAMPAGSVMLHDLRDKPDIAIDVAAHGLVTYGRRPGPAMPRGGLARWQVRRAKELLGAELMQHRELTDVARSRSAISAGPFAGVWGIPRMDGCSGGGWNAPRRCCATARRPWPRSP